MTTTLHNQILDYISKKEEIIKIKQNAKEIYIKYKDILNKVITKSSSKSSSSSSSIILQFSYKNLQDKTKSQIILDNLIEFQNILLEIEEKEVCLSDDFLKFSKKSYLKIEFLLKNEFVSFLKNSLFKIESHCLLLPKELQEQKGEDYEDNHKGNISIYPEEYINYINILNDYIHKLSSSLFIQEAVEEYIIQLLNEIHSLSSKVKCQINWNSNKNQAEFNFLDNDKAKSFHWKDNLECLRVFYIKFYQILIWTVSKIDLSNNFKLKTTEVIYKRLYEIVHIYIINLLRITASHKNFSMSEFEYFKIFIDEINTENINNVTFNHKDYSDYFKVIDNENMYFNQDSLLSIVRSVLSQVFQETDLCNSIDDIESNMKKTNHIDLVYEIFSYIDSHHMNDRQDSLEEKSNLLIFNYNQLEKLKSVILSLSFNHEDDFSNIKCLSSKVIVSMSFPILVKTLFLKMNFIYPTDEDILSLQVIIELYDLYYNSQMENDFLKKILLFNNFTSLHFLFKFMVFYHEVNNQVVDKNIIAFVNKLSSINNSLLGFIMDLLVSRVIDEFGKNDISSFSQSCLNSHYLKYDTTLKNVYTLYKNFYSKLLLSINEAYINQTINYTLSIIFDIISKYIINIKSINIDDSLALSKLIRGFISSIKSILTEIYTNDSKRIEEVEGLLESNCKYRKCQEILFILNANLKQIKNLILTCQFKTQIGKEEFIYLVSSLFEDTPFRSEFIQFVTQGYSS